MKRKQLFDYDWKFFLGDASEAKANDFNDAGWRKLDLPMIGVSKEKYILKILLVEVADIFRQDIVCIVKTFQVPDSWKAKKIAMPIKINRF